MYRWMDGDSVVGQTAHVYARVRYAMGIPLDRVLCGVYVLQSSYGYACLYDPCISHDLDEHESLSGNLDLRLRLRRRMRKFVGKTLNINR